MSPRGRMDWAKDLPFPVPVVGEDVEDLSEVEYLFWVGCAGAYEDRAKKTTRAVAELLHTAGVELRGARQRRDVHRRPRPARRQRVRLSSSWPWRTPRPCRRPRRPRSSSTCAHCLNTLKNEYPQLGVELEVVHHTQLLNRLVARRPTDPGRTPARLGCRSHDHLP